MAVTCQVLISITRFNWLAMVPTLLMELTGSSETHGVLSGVRTVTSAFAARPARKSAVLTRLLSTDPAVMAAPLKLLFAENAEFSTITPTPLSLQSNSENHLVIIAIAKSTSLYM